MSKAVERAMIDVFFALADETRLSVVRKLGAGAPLSATVLSDGGQVTRQAVVKHLQVLEGAGLVTRERRGREVLYSLEARRLDEARAFIEGVSASWDRAIARLRGTVEQAPSRPRGAAASARVRGRRPRRGRS